MQWPADAWLARRGQALILERASHLPQVVRSESDLDGPQLKLVRELCDASQRGAAAARSRAYDREKQLLMRRLTDQQSTWSNSDIEEWIGARIKDVKSAEVGAWRVTTGRGELIDTMSSGDRGKIQPSTIQESLNRLLGAPRLDRRDIQSVEFWHTHPPWLSPLSGDDGRAFESFVRGLRAGGIRSPVSMSAITELTGRRLIFTHTVGV